MKWINDAVNKEIEFQGCKQKINPAKVNCPVCVIAGLLRLTRKQKLYSTGDVAWDLHRHYGRKEIIKNGITEGRKIQHSNIVISDWKEGYSKNPDLADKQRTGMIEALKKIYKLDVESAKLPPEVFVGKDNYITGIDLSKIKKLKKLKYIVGYLIFRAHWMNIIINWNEEKVEFVDFQCHHRDKDINKYFGYHYRPYDSWGSFDWISTLDLVEKTPFVYCHANSVSKPLKPQKNIITEKCITM